MAIHSTITLNSQKVENTQMINKMLFTYTILFHNKKEKSIDTYHNMDKP